MPAPTPAQLLADATPDIWRWLIIAMLSGFNPDGSAFTLPTTATVATAVDITDRSGRLVGHVTVDNASLAVTGTFWQATQPVSLATNTPDVTDRAARLLGHVTVDNASLAVTGTFWQATQPVSIAATVATKEVKAATSAVTSVASSASNVQLLASNANRLGATIFNDSTQVLYVKLGVTASTTSYTIQMQSASYYEVPFGWTGEIDGIWASANGNARITELTA